MTVRKNWSHDQQLLSDDKDQQTAWPRARRPVGRAGKRENPANMFDNVNAWVLVDGYGTFEAKSRRILLDERSKSLERHGDPRRIERPHPSGIDGCSWHAKATASHGSLR